MAKKKSYVSGRNSYPQNCVVCGVMCKRVEGFLKKRPKGYTGYEVIHEHCKAQLKESVVFEGDVLKVLEDTLKSRQLNGEKIVFLPKIIEYIKYLESKCK